MRICRVAFLFSTLAGLTAPIVFADDIAQPAPGVAARHVWLADALLPKQMQVGDEIELEMAARLRLVGRIESSEGSNRTALARGSLRDDPFGVFWLAVSQDDAGLRVVGEVRTSRDTFRLYSPLANQIFVEQLDELTIEMCHTLDAVAGRPHGAAGGDAARGSDPVDLLIAYTPAAAAYVGGALLVQQLARQYALDVNQYYESSLIANRVRLVGLVLTPYTESGTYLNNLNRLRDADDGPMDELHLLRDALGADLVALLADVNDVCGVAWLYDDDPTLAFSMTSIRCTSFTFSHELGHNLGCCHDRGNAGGGCFTPSAYGWRFFGDSGEQWRTIMSYAPGTRIGHFSNPNVQFDGEPTGTPNDYNAATIPLTFPGVAAYRADEPFQDCDGNLIADAIDIATGAAVDANGDGVIDTCAPPCPGDLNGDGQVDLSDLATLLAHFGVASGATYADGDLTGDGAVDLSDLALLLASFGTACP